MRKLLFLVLVFLVTASLGYSQTTFADYETISPNFTGWDGTTFTVVDNPEQSGINTSAKCAQTNTSDQGWGWAGMYTNQLGGTIDFTSGSTFTMDVKAPFECNVLFKLEGSGGVATEVTTAVQTGDVGIWATMSFIIPDATNDKYDKIVLIFDAGGTTTSDQWFFDNIEGPGFTPLTGEQVTFTVLDYTGITTGIIRVYDNASVTTEYTLYDDGTNGDPVSGDLAWTAVATDLTGSTVLDAPGVGAYSYELVNGGTTVSDEIEFTLSAGEQKTLSYSYYSGTINNDTVFCEPTTLTPAIDGTLDALWASFNSVPVTKTVSGGVDNPADLTASIKTVYDATTLYILAQITDETLNDAHANAWERDNMEFYFDMDNNDAYNGNDGQKRWIWNDANAGSPGTSAQSNTANGWLLEIAIPFESLATGFTMQNYLNFGFDINANDNDGGNREGILSWHINSDAAWNTASGLGTMHISHAQVTISNDGTITEGAENGEIITVTLKNDEFVASIDPANWTFSSNLPTGVSIGSITRLNATTVEIVLSGNATADYDANRNLTLAIDASEFTTYSIIDVPATSAATFTAIVEAEIALSQTGTIVEGSEDAKIITVTLTNDTFVASLNSASWTVTNLPTGVSVGAVSRIDATTATITLSGNSTIDYDVNITNVSVSIAATELSTWNATVSKNSGITFTAIVEGSATFTIADDGEILEHAENAEIITISILNDEFVASLTPANWTISNLPAGVSLGSINRISNTSAEIILSGNASTDYDVDITNLSVSITQAEFVNALLPSSANTGVTFTAVIEPATIAIVSDGEILEAATNGEVITVTLSQDEFVSTLTSSNWTVQNLPVGVTVGSINRVNANTATITLSGNPTLDLYRDITNITVTVKAAELVSFGSDVSVATGVIITAIIPAEPTYTYANYETNGTSITFTGWANNPFSVENNPLKAGNNLSDKVGYTITNDEGWGWEGISGTVLPQTINFNDGTLFTMNVLAPRETTILFKLENAANSNVNTEVRGRVEEVGVWTTVYFEFANANNGFANDTYDKFVLFFDTETDNFDDWYFDDIKGPSLKIPGIDASLNDIKMNGIALAGFSPATIGYTIQLPYGTVIVPEITATATDTNAAAIVTATTSLPGTTTIVVTAENGTTTKTYSVNFTIAANNDATLSSLKVDGVSVPNFSKDSIQYSIELPYGTIVIPTVIALASDTNANLLVTNATTLPGTTSVAVTAEDGISVKTYSLSFTFAPPSTDASLSELLINNLGPLDFTSSTIAYNVELPFGTTLIPTVSAIASDSTANVVVSQATTLTGSATVVVTAQDGTTVKTYTINFSVSEFISADATLRSIKVDNTDLVNFSSTTLNYNVDLPFGTTQVPTVTAISTNTAASVVITNATNISETTSIVVTAQDSTTKLTYTVKFTLAKPSYKVSFIISDAAQNALADAQVVFMTDTLVTDINGLVEFTSVSPTTDASYKVTKTGYVDATGTCSVVDTNVVVNVTLQLKTYSVNFFVIDSAQNPLAEAKVSFQGDTLFTDANGKLTFDSIPPVNTANYTISKAGFMELNGALSVIDADVDQTVTLQIQTYSVRFTVVNSSEVLLAGAEVVFMLDTLQTDMNGFVEFSSVSPTTDAVYTVKKSGYVDVEGILSIVDSSVDLKVTLQEVTYEVTFTVLDKNELALADAEVVFNEITMTTDANGLAIFSSVSPVVDAAYTISKEGYIEASGLLSVVDAYVELTVQLLSVGVQDKSILVSSIYPNPTNGGLTIKLSSQISKASVELIDINGKIVNRIELNVLETTMDLSSNQSGVYFLKVTSGNAQFIEKIVISK